MKVFDIQKWDFKGHKYRAYTPDPSWKIVMLSNDMDLEINCTNCGNIVVYGETYTSRTLHNRFGLGYPVCEKCYLKEWEDEKASKNK